MNTIDIKIINDNKEIVLEILNELKKQYKPRASFVGKKLELLTLIHSAELIDREKIHGQYKYITNAKGDRFINDPDEFLNEPESNDKRNISELEERLYLSNLELNDKNKDFIEKQTESLSIQDKVNKSTLKQSAISERAYRSSIETNKATREHITEIESYNEKVISQTKWTIGLSALSIMLSGIVGFYVIKDTYQEDRIYLVPQKSQLKLTKTAIDSMELRLLNKIEALEHVQDKTSHDEEKKN